MDIQFIIYPFLQKPWHDNMEALQTHNTRLMKKIASCQKRLRQHKLEVEWLQQLINKEEARILSTNNAFNHNNQKMILIAESTEEDRWHLLHKEPPLDVDNGQKYLKNGLEQSKLSFCNNHTVSDENSDDEEDSDSETENEERQNQNVDVHRFLMMLQAEIKAEREH